MNDKEIRVGMLASGGLLAAVVGFNLTSSIWFNPHSDPAPVEEVVEDGRFSPPAGGYTCRWFDETFHTPGGAEYFFDTLSQSYSDVMEKAALGGASEASIDFTGCMIDNSRYVVEFTARACGVCYSKEQNSTDQFTKVNDGALDVVLDYCESGSDLEFYDWIADEFAPKAPRRKGLGNTLGNTRI